LSRTILHVDLNNCYASIECLYRPEIRNSPVVVGGDPEARHGIVLAKNYLAKAMGVKTGEVLWQAKQKCPGLVIVPPDFKKYLRFSRMAREIYADYTNQIEAFGIDENWLDVTGAEHISGDGEKIADTIRQRVKSELGVTVSVGVSWNKTFAKLGSDMKKPDAITVISENNFKQKVWPLPVGDLLYVGRATKQKFANRAIFTIGDLAKRNVRDLKLLLGVWGETLWQFANGFDNAPIRQLGEESIVKSVGNSTTTVRDLVNIEDVKLIIYVLAESVAVRLRSHGLKCTTVAISVRNNELISFERQGKISTPTFVSGDIAAKAMELFKANYTWDKPIRSLGVRGADLVTADRHIQLNLFKCDQSDRESLERTIDSLRERFGSYCIQRCAMMIDSNLTGFNPKNDHVIHPVAFTR